MPSKNPAKVSPDPAQRALKESPELKRTQVRGDGRSQGSEEDGKAADANLAGPRAEGRKPPGRRT